MDRFNDRLLRKLLALVAPSTLIRLSSLNRRINSQPLPARYLILNILNAQQDRLHRYLYHIKTDAQGIETLSTFSLPGEGQGERIKVFSRRPIPKGPTRFQVFRGKVSSSLIPVNRSIGGYYFGVIPWAMVDGRPKVLLGRELAEVGYPLSESWAPFGWYSDTNDEALLADYGYRTSMGFLGSREEINDLMSSATILRQGSYLLAAYRIPYQPQLIGVFKRGYDYLSRCSTRSEAGLRFVESCPASWFSKSEIGYFSNIEIKKADILPQFRSIIEELFTSFKTPNKKRKIMPSNPFALLAEDDTNSTTN